MMKLQQGEGNDHALLLFCTKLKTTTISELQIICDPQF